MDDGNLARMNDLASSLEVRGRRDAADLRQSRNSIFTIILNCSDGRFNLTGEFILHIDD